MATEHFSHHDASPTVGDAPVVHSYALDWKRAITAGLVGTVAITLLMYFGPPLMGMKPMDIGTMLGTMFLPQGGAAAFWLGMTMHFMIGIILVLIYAAVLLALHRQSTWGAGAVFGIVLWLIGPMLIVPVMMAMHPLVKAGQMMNPGFFMLGMDKGLLPAMSSLMMHLVYSIIAAVIYKHLTRPTTRQGAMQ